MMKNWWFDMIWLSLKWFFIITFLIRWKNIAIWMFFFSLNLGAKIILLWEWWEFGIKNHLLLQEHWKWKFYELIHIKKLAQLFVLHNTWGSGSTLYFNVKSVYNLQLNPCGSLNPMILGYNVPAIIFDQFLADRKILPHLRLYIDSQR